MKTLQRSTSAQNFLRLSLGTLLLLALLPAAIQAAPGDLDLTFGTGGVVTTPVVNPPNGIWASSMLVQGLMSFWRVGIEFKSS